MLIHEAANLTTQKQMREIEELGLKCGAAIVLIGAACNPNGLILINDETRYGLNLLDRDRETPLKTLNRIVRERSETAIKEALDRTF